MKKILMFLVLKTRDCYNYFDEKVSFKVESNKEYIICSAIWFDNGEVYPHQPKNIETGFVIAGRRYHNCFATLGATSHMDFKKVNFEKVKDS